MSLLKDYLEQKVVVITTLGDTLEGILAGFDKHSNIILENCQPRFHSRSIIASQTKTIEDVETESETKDTEANHIENDKIQIEKVKLLRGSEIVCIGLVDEALEKEQLEKWTTENIEKINLSKLKDTKNKVKNEFEILKLVAEYKQQLQEQQQEIYIG